MTSLLQLSVLTADPPFFPRIPRCGFTHTSSFRRHVLLFDQKKKLSSEDAEKWPNVLLFGIMNSENMSNHSTTKNFGKVSEQTTACGSDDLFLVITCFWAEKWTCAYMMTPKEPVLLLRSENMVTLPRCSF